MRGIRVGGGGVGAFGVSFTVGHCTAVYLEEDNEERRLNRARRGLANSGATEHTQAHLIYGVHAPSEDPSLRTEDSAFSKREHPFDSLRARRKFGTDSRMS